MKSRILLTVLILYMQHMYASDNVSIQVLGVNNDSVSYVIKNETEKEIYTSCELQIYDDDEWIVVAPYHDFRLQDLQKRSLIVTVESKSERLEMYPIDTFLMRNYPCRITLRYSFSILDAEKNETYSNIIPYKLNKRKERFDKDSTFKVFEPANYYDETIRRECKLNCVKKK